MKILLIGYGKVGSVLAKLLLRQKAVRQLTCATWRPIRDHLLPGIVFRTVDAGSSTAVNALLAETLPTIVVNCSLPRYNENILRCCWQQGCHYLDLASFWERDNSRKAPSPYCLEQFAYHQKFQQKKLLGLINAGLSPGLTNLLAAECATALEQVDYLKVRLLEECKTKQPFIAWSKEVLLAQMSLKPVVYERGHYVLHSPFSGEEFFTFPPPGGRKKVWLVAQEEVETIPLYLQVKRCDVKSHDNYRDLTAIANAPDTPDQEMLRELQRAFFAVSVEATRPPVRKQPTRKAAEPRDSGGENKRLSVIFPRQEEINSLNLGANFITYPTALVTALFIAAFPKMKERGIFSPEGINAEVRKTILMELGKIKGVRIIKEGFE